MTFAQRRNRLTTPFSERIPVVKRRISTASVDNSSLREARWNKCVATRNILGHKLHLLLRSGIDRTHTATRTELVKRFVYSASSIDHITLVAQRCSLSNWESCDMASKLRPIFSIWRLVPFLRHCACLSPWTRFLINLLAPELFF